MKQSNSRLTRRTRLNAVAAGFADYFQFLPTVSAQQFGPGQAQIYMRGVADGGDGNFSGTTPSVALYLDDQPVTAIGRNLDVVEEDYNAVTNSGARAALGIDLNDAWTAAASVIAQSQQSDGVFADQPGPGGPGQGRVERFFQDNYADAWTQWGLTLTGDLGFADFTFAGSYLDREIDYDIDYSQYAEYSNYVEYNYTCVAYDFSDCTDPRIQYENDSTFERSSIELRVSESWNDLFVNARARQDSYGLLNLSGVVAFADTNLSVYVNNATDENAELK